MEVEEIQSYEVAPEEVLEIDQDGYEKIDGFDALNTNVFEAGNACPGCGPQAVLKIILQTMGKGTIVVCSPKYAPCESKNSCVPAMVKDFNILIADDPISVAKNLQKNNEKSKIVCFTDTLTSEELEGDVFVVNWNNGESKWKDGFGLGAEYVGTASIGFLEDLMFKVRKAANLSGSRFIDVFAPCYVRDGFEALDTTLVAKLAVTTALWNLFEIQDGKFRINHRIEPEPIERFYDMVRNDLTEEEMAALQSKIKKNWAILIRRRFWEAE